jgi:hypothetical protein
MASFFFERPIAMEGIEGPRTKIIKLKKYVKSY